MHDSCDQRGSGREKSSRNIHCNISLRGIYTMTFCLVDFTAMNTDPSPASCIDDGTKYFSIRNLQQYYMTKGFRV